MSQLDSSDQDANQKVASQDRWPQYYVGAYPYCYQIPAFSGAYPPPVGALQMGQSPGTHWYHAHKHGSTAINVANGMTGVFIIEGPTYDDKLNDWYDPGWEKKGRVPWTRTQPDGTSAFASRSTHPLCQSATPTQRCRPRLPVPHRQGLRQPATRLPRPPSAPPRPSAWASRLGRLEPPAARPQLW